MPIEQLKLFPDGESKDAKLYIEHDKSVDEWIAERHYLKCAPAGAIIRMCFKDNRQKVIGCMMWGRPTSRRLDQERILELTRMCFIDDTMPFIESHCLGLARKYIRKHHPKVKGLVAYSSTGQGHDGTIYKADGWFEMSSDKYGGTWENREHRFNRDLSRKIRWARSP